MICLFLMSLVRNFLITKKEAKSFFPYFQHLRRNTFDILKYFAFPKIQVVTDKTTKTFTVFFSNALRQYIDFTPNLVKRQISNFNFKKLIVV